MKLGFTGTREGMSRAQKRELEKLLHSLGTIEEFHHGDCVGADAESHEITLRLNVPIVIHPPDNDSLRAFCEGAIRVMPKAPYLKRNRNIVSSTDLLIVAPLTDVEALHSGTWSTKRYAQSIPKPFKILPR